MKTSAIGLTAAQLNTMDLPALRAMHRMVVGQDPEAPLLEEIGLQILRRERIAAQYAEKAEIDEEKRKRVAAEAARQKRITDTATCAKLGLHQNEIAAKIDAGIASLVDLMEQLRATHHEIRQVAAGVKHPLGTDSYLEMLTIYAKRNMNLSGFMGQVQAERGPTMAEASAGWTSGLLNELHLFLAGDIPASSITQAAVAAE